MLEYEARTSAILLPFSGLPWLLGIAIRSLRQANDRAAERRSRCRWAAAARRGWRWPAIFALVIVTVGSINATSLLFAGLVPVLWVPWAIWGSARCGFGPRWRRLRAPACSPCSRRSGGSSACPSSRGYGLDVLRYSETVQTVATTSHPVEVLRGLGNWYFYGRDRVDHWVQTSIGLLTFLPQMALSYFVPLLGIAAAAFVRWRHRAFFVATDRARHDDRGRRLPIPAPQPRRQAVQGLRAGLDRRPGACAAPGGRCRSIALGLAVLLAGRRRMRWATGWSAARAAARLAAPADTGARPRRSRGWAAPGRSSSSWRCSSSPTSVRCGPATSSTRGCRAPHPVPGLLEAGGQGRWTRKGSADPRPRAARPGLLVLPLGHDLRPGDCPA